MESTVTQIESTYTINQYLHIVNKNKSYVYIITNKPNGTLYIGVTSNLAQRIYNHKNKTFESFSKRYNLNKLVYYELFDDIKNAIIREKQLKEWRRAWKLKIIIDFNPNWKDLYYEIT